MKYIKYINEIWRFPKKKKKINCDLTEYEGYKIDDWILIDDDDMNIGDIIVIITNIKKWKYYTRIGHQIGGHGGVLFKTFDGGIDTVLFDIRFPNEKTSFTINFISIIRKLTPEEIEIEKMKMETDKYNL